MIPRVLEPEVMDTAEEAADYDAMDHATVNRAFVDDLLAAGRVGPDILDLGTGTARIPVEICRRLDACRVMAADLAVEMLEVARYHLEMEGLTERIQLDQADAKQLPYADQMFDSVISNSIVHHVPDPERVLREAIRVTRPGGLLFFRDLIRPSSESELEQLVATYAGEENKRQQKMFADSLRAALTLEEIRQLVAACGFAAESVQATSDRHWTWSARRAPADGSEAME